MLPKKLPVALALLGLAGSALAAATDEPWYFGVKAGHGEFQGIKYGDSVMNPRHVDKSGVAGGLFLGYRFNDWLGVEAGYDYLGKLKFDFGAANHADLKVQGLQLAARLGMPVSESFDVYTRLGVMASRMSGNGDTMHRTAPLAAVGLEYALNRNWATRLEYQWVGRLGNRDDAGVRANNGQLALGVLYKFGGTPRAAPAPVAMMEPAPPPAPAPVAAVVPQARAFTLNADTLFDFDLAILRPGAEQALFTLMRQIRAEAATDASLSIVGHTDRLGSDQYNLDLSRRRAQTVADFLVSNGVPRSLVTVEGAGEAMPVSGAQCNALQNRAALIACLAPDRRVVVLVRGTTMS